MKQSSVPIVLMLMFVGAGAAIASGRAESDVPADQAPAELPELAAVGGVQDLWPFEFSLADSRDTVRNVLGDPEEIRLRMPTGEAMAGTPKDDEPFVADWTYQGMLVIFIVDSAQDIEYVLSVRVWDPEIRFGAGLSVGMPVSEAVSVLGEPSLEQGDDIVYFYLDTTIQLVRDGDVVSEFILSRAMS